MLLTVRQNRIQRVGGAEGLFVCFKIFILQYVCLILSSLTGTDLCPSFIPSSNLARDVNILETLQVCKANVFLGKYEGGKGCKEMFRKTGHLGKNTSIFINITLSVFSLLILGQIVSLESLLSTPHTPTHFFPTRPMESNLPTLTFSVYISRIFLSDPEASKHVLDTWACICVSGTMCGSLSHLRE